MRTLNAVKFTTTGDHIFYVNDYDYELLKNDPHVILVTKSVEVREDIIDDFRQ